MSVSSPSSMTDARINITSIARAVDAIAIRNARLEPTWSQNCWCQFGSFKVVSHNPPGRQGGHACKKNKPRSNITWIGPLAMKTGTQCKTMLDVRSFAICQSTCIANNSITYLNTNRATIPEVIFIELNKVTSTLLKSRSSYWNHKTTQLAAAKPKANVDIKFRIRSPLPKGWRLSAKQKQKMGWLLQNQNI